MNASLSAGESLLCAHSVGSTIQKLCEGQVNLGKTIFLLAALSFNRN